MKLTAQEHELGYPAKQADTVTVFHGCSTYKPTSSSVTLLNHNHLAAHNKSIIFHSMKQVS